MPYYIPTLSDVVSKAATRIRVRQKEAILPLELLNEILLVRPDSADFMIHSMNLESSSLLDSELYHYGIISCSHSDRIIIGFRTLWLWCHFFLILIKSSLDSELYAYGIISFSHSDKISRYVRPSTFFVVFAVSVLFLGRTFFRNFS